MKKLIAYAALFAISVTAAEAASRPLTIGMMLTLSGPSAVLGQHARDGFQLAIKELGGKLGGLDANVIIVDDQLDPAQAALKVKDLIALDKIDIFVGVIFSNVMTAVYKPLIDSHTIIVSPNAGPSPIAGKECSPYFFSTSWQNDQNSEVMGAYADGKGYRRVIAIAPDYQAGKDAVAGFRRYFRGTVVAELSTKLGQLDFSTEVMRIAAEKPDAVFAFMPGGMGVELVKQYDAAGLAATTPFLSAFTIDETTLPATQDAALGMFAGAQWAPDLDNAANKAFVSAFTAEFGYVPALYAAQAYDAARLIDSAVRTANGNLDDKAGLIAALVKANFPSTRGGFRFNTNHMPIQDFYLVEAVKRDGRYQTSAVQKIFEKHEDAYAAECPMK